MGAYITIPWGAVASRGGPKGGFCEYQKKQFLKYSSEPFQREVTLKFLGYRTQDTTLGAL